MIEAVRHPGLGTLAVHCAGIVALSALLLILWPFRVVSSLAAELLIRLSDSTSDALRDRLGR